MKTKKVRFVKVYLALLENFNVAKALRISLVINFKFAKVNFFIENKYMTKVTYYNIMKNIKMLKNLYDFSKEKFFMIEIKDFESMKKDIKQKIVEFANSKRKAVEMFVVSFASLKEIKVEECYMKKRRKKKEEVYFTKYEVMRIKSMRIDDFKIILSYVKRHIKREDFDLDTLCEVLEEFEDKSVQYLIASLKKAYLKKLNTKIEQRYFEMNKVQNEVQEKQREIQEEDKYIDKEIDDLMIECGLLMRFDNSKKNTMKEIIYEQY